MESLIVSSGGEYGAACLPNGQIEIWQTTSSQTRVLGGVGIPSGSVLAFSSRADLLAEARLDKDITIRDVATGSVRVVLHGHHGIVNALAFAPTGRTLVSASEDRSIRLWNVATGQEVMTLEGHLDKASLRQFSPDGRALASSSNGLHDRHELFLWDTNGWEPDKPSTE